MDRTEMADFLRHCRTRLAPADVGLSQGARRRTPGLRREEVAQLAGMSTDHYTRLEQARGSRPSRQMLAAVARALRLTGDERDHLFHLAGEEPPRNRPTTTHVRPGLLLVLDRLTDTPAQVVSDSGDARPAGLVRRLRARSEEFSTLWDTHEVAVRRADTKRFCHPVVGLLELDCEVLLSPEHDQRLVVHTAPPGSESHERLELLRVVGLQNLTRG